MYYYYDNQQNSKWSPKNAGASLALWLDFSNALTLWQNSNKTTQVASNTDPIGYALNLNNNASYDVTQATSGRRPIWGNSQINGVAGAVFANTSTQNLGGGTPFAGTSGDFFAVIKGSISGQTIFGQSKASVSTQFMIFSQQDGGSGIKPLIAMTGNGVTNQLSGNTTLSNSTAYVLNFRSTGSAYEIYVNGSKQTLSATAGNNDGKWFNQLVGADNFVIGGVNLSGSLVNAYNGNQGEVTLFTTVLPPVQRGAEEARLASKFGITLGP